MFLDNLGSPPLLFFFLGMLAVLLRSDLDIPNAVGAGERGVRRADELAGDSGNTLFIIACDQPALVETLLERLRPLLSRHGGICLVSESRWLMH